MAKFVTTYQPSTKAKRYIKKIRLSLQSALGDFLDIGSTLKEAEDVLGRKEWLDMVTNELPFLRRTAEKLVKIASDNRITDPRNAEFLPPHWTSLHEITLLSDAQFKAGIKSGAIHADAERKDITILKTKRKAKKASANSTSKRTPINGFDNTDPSQLALNHDDQRRPTKGEQSSLAVAEFSTDREFTPDEAEGIEAALIQFSEEHGLTLTLSRNIRHQSLLQDIERNLFKRMDEVRKETKDNDLQLITDAFFQFEIGKTFKANPDGSFQANDLRNPDNPFHGFDKQQLYGYCLDLQLMTQYTPIEFLDYEAFIQMLMWRYLTGNEIQRMRARETLKTVADDEGKRKAKSKRIFERKNISYDEAWMGQNHAQQMLELIGG